METFENLMKTCVLVPKTEENNRKTSIFSETNHSVYTECLLLAVVGRCITHFIDF